MQYICICKYTNIEKMVQKTSIRATLIALDKGQKTLIPMDICREAYIRQCASLLKKLNRRYEVHVNHEAASYEVVRIS